MKNLPRDLRHGLVLLALVEALIFGGLAGMACEDLAVQSVLMVAIAALISAQVVFVREAFARGKGER